MLAIEVRFLANRFHATPWDQQVNEGAVEWPPSPWRVARALVATWHQKARADVPEADVRAALRLFETPPAYRLPQAVVAHTRHFMPTKGDDKTKVFDTFVRPIDWRGPQGESEQAALVMAWENAPDLTEGGREALRALLPKLSYLGRAESWVEARLLEDWEGVPNAWPHADPSVRTTGRERLRLLAPEGGERFAAWRTLTLDAHVARRLAELAARPAAKGKTGGAPKLAAKDLSAIEAGLPPDIFQALHADVGELRKRGWSQPPGSRWVAYERPADALAGGAPPARSAENTPRYDFARFALVGKPLPRLEDAVRYGELLRRTAMKASQAKTNPANDRDAASVFTGHAAGGKALDDHAHAFFLPESHGRGAERGRITHLTVFARAGFDADDQRALSRCRRLYDGEPDAAVNLVLLGFGRAGEVDGPSSARGEPTLLDTSRVWESVTPFVPSRHFGKGGKAGPRDGVVAQVRRELAYHGLPSGDDVTIEWLDDAPSRARWLRFRRQRSHGVGARGSGQGFGLRITFPQPVRGPIALGYAAHFGLGRFEPVEARDG